MLALGAASSAIDSLFGLISPKQTQATNSGQDQPNLFAFRADAATNSAGTSAPPAAGGGAQIAPETMSALLAAQSQSGSTFQPMSREDALKDLFSKIDADGDGKITKDEFEKALGAGGTNTAQADDVFGKLDKDGDGSVTMSGSLRSSTTQSQGLSRRVASAPAPVSVVTISMSSWSSNSLMLICSTALSSTISRRLRRGRAYSLICESAALTPSVVVGLLTKENAPRASA